MTKFNKLLKPIISRFCKIHVFYPIIDDIHINLHQYKITKIKNKISIGDTILLYGEIGVGKTTFARLFINNLEKYNKSFI